MVEFSPATRETRVRFPAVAEVLFLAPRAARREAMSSSVFALARSRLRVPDGLAPVGPLGPLRDRQPECRRAAENAKKRLHHAPASRLQKSSCSPRYTRRSWRTQRRRPSARARGRAPRQQGRDTARALGVEGAHAQRRGGCAPAQWCLRQCMWPRRVAGEGPKLVCGVRMIVRGAQTCLIR